MGKNQQHLMNTVYRSGHSQLGNILNSSNKVVDFNPMLENSVTHSSGDVSKFVDSKGNIEMTPFGSGSEVTFDSNKGYLQFNGGKGLEVIVGDSAIKDACSFSAEKTVFLVYGVDSSSATYQALFESMKASGDRFGIGHKTNLLRYANYNGTDFIGKQSYTDGETVRKAVAVYKFDGTTASGSRDKLPFDGVQSAEFGSSLKVTLGLKTHFSLKILLLT